MLPALILNIVTDLCIMAIPAPVIFPVKTTIWRKISLVIIFSAGFFIMIAAILRVSMVLVQGNGSTAAIWSCREDFVAICVGQAPIRKCRNIRSPVVGLGLLITRIPSTTRPHQEILDR